MIGLFEVRIFLFVIVVDMVLFFKFNIVYSVFDKVMEDF